MVNKLSLIIFFIIILLSNIIQGITGFAGTILAMPVSLILVGYDVAKPLLNVLGILAGVYVFATNRKDICIKELKKILLIMILGIFFGIYLKSLFKTDGGILYYFLGIFIIVLSIQGFYKIVKDKKKTEKDKTEEDDKDRRWTSLLLLISSGIIHGMFVSGGPLLIAYLSKRLKDKKSFRATISTVWIVLNSIILIDDILQGLWTVDLIKIQIIAIPFFVAGMVIGCKLYEKMNQVVFMKLTYILMFISGITLLVR